ncbi:MAG: sulfate transporter [Burkholderiales bacterium RIFOXYD12_FULL_59_19]|nr:MAG: sulfate transporter [Burkholderiales bacterium RIFOXYD12_FULL_59_19]
MTETTPTPAGYWLNGQGNLIPDAKVKTIDKLCDELVRALAARAITQSEALEKFKRQSMDEVLAFLALSQSEYGVARGRNKGNVTLSTYDMTLRITRSMQDKIAFGPSLLAAKELIDECAQEWSVDANDNVKVVIQHAFQTDREGKINIANVLALKNYEIKDEKWLRAMKAIDDSIKTVGTTPYIRFHKRNEKTLKYEPIVLDLAAL